MGKAVIKLTEAAVIDGRLRAKGEIVSVTLGQAQDLVAYGEAVIIVDAETMATRERATQEQIEHEKAKHDKKRCKTKFKGRIEQMPTEFIGDWIVAGRTVRVTEDTKLSGETPAVGLVAEVDGLDWGDYVEAEKVKVKKPESVKLDGKIEALP